MNIQTGELLTDERFKELMQKDSERAKAFKPVPDELEEEAKKELAGRDRTVVDLKKRTPLANWARSQRSPYPKKNMRKVRRKIADASKKRNRK